MISKAELEAMGCVFWMPNPFATKPDVINNISFSTIKGTAPVETNSSDGNNSSMFSGGSISNTSSVSQLNLTTQFSWCCWIYPTSFSNYLILYDKYDSSSIDILFRLNSLSGELYFQNASGSSIATITTSIPTLKSWNFATVTYNGGTVNIYLDSTLKGTTTLGSTCTNNTDIKHIGRSYNNNYPFAGNMKDMMFFNTVLTPEQIEYIYKRTFIR